MRFSLVKGFLYNYISWLLLSLLVGVYASIAEDKITDFSGWINFITSYMMVSILIGFFITLYICKRMGCNPREEP